MRNLRDGKKYGRFNGSLLVFITLIIHILLLLEVIKFFVNPLGRFPSLNYLTIHRLFEIFVLITIMLGTYFYYNEKKIERIVDKYQLSQVTNQQSKSGYIFFTSIFFIPLLLLLLIGWKR